MTAMQASAAVSSVNQKAGSESSPVDTEADFVAEGLEAFAAGVADAFFTALFESPACGHSGHLFRGTGGSS